MLLTITISAFLYSLSPLFLPHFLVLPSSTLSLSSPHQDAALCQSALHVLMRLLKPRKPKKEKVCILRLLNSSRVYKIKKCVQKVVLKFCRQLFLVDADEDGSIPLQYPYDWMLPRMLHSLIPRLLFIKGCSLGMRLGVAGCVAESA